jgi:hypothetical protein
MNAAVKGLVDALDELANWHDHACDVVIGRPCDCKAKVARAALAAFEKATPLEDTMDEIRAIVFRATGCGIAQLAQVDRDVRAVLGPRERQT